MDRGRGVQESMTSSSIPGVRSTDAVAAVDPMEEVYRRIGPRLWRALFASSGDPEVASDALAEAFAQAIVRSDGIRSLEPWLWTAAFKIAAGELSRKNDPSRIPAEPTYEMSPPADHIVSALRQLSPKQRAAVVLHDYADRPTEEVAEALGISSATVHVHLGRARRRLRRLLEDRDG
jgi:RNA polymerase sigma-70 factor (ECF subfamily)